MYTSLKVHGHVTSLMPHWLELVPLIPLAKSTFRLVLYNQNHSNQNGQSEQREISLGANEN